MATQYAVTQATPDCRQHRRRGSRSPRGVKAIFTEGAAFELKLKDEQRISDISDKENGVRDDDKKFILAGGKIQRGKENGRVH